MAVRSEIRYGPLLILLALLTLDAGPRAVTLWGQSVRSPTHEVDTLNGAGLRPGDMVRVSSWREENMSGDFMVHETGSVMLPLLGPTRVLGIALPDLRDDLLDRYEKLLLEPVVDIILLRRVRILGEVRNPGVYHVDPTMTLGDLVALAGGATPDGKLDDTRIMGRSEIVHANLEADVPVTELLQSGDQILVPRRSWLARNHLFLVGTVISAATLFLSRGSLF